MRGRFDAGKLKRRQHTVTDDSHDERAHRSGTQTGGAAVLPAATANDLSIGFGTAAECAAAHFADPLGASPRCTMAGASLVCR